MTELKFIEQALADVSKERESLMAKKPTKSLGRRLEALEVKEGNLEQIKAAVEGGIPFTNMYVSKDIGAEVGIIDEVKGEGKVEVIYLDGSKSVVKLADLCYDEKATSEYPSQVSQITVGDKVYKLGKLIYPGQVELEGVEGLIAPADWSKVDEEETVTTEAISEEAEEDVNPEELYTGGAINADTAPPVSFTKIIDDRTFGLYRFVIGSIDDNLMVGQLYQKSVTTDEEMLIQTEPNNRYHWVRSVLVRKYHSIVKPLRAGDKISIHPYLLAFAPENQEAYYPVYDEKVEDIREDIQNGIGILQRVGVADWGELYSGVRRTWASLLEGQEEIPIEVKHFDSRIAFIESLFNANKQREITPEIKARVREVYYKYCSAEARQAQLAALATKGASSRPPALGSAWERAVAEEEGISASTASVQSKIIKWCDKCNDKELAVAIMQVFNKDKKTKTCQDLIEYANYSIEDTKTVARMIANGEANTIGKAIVKAGLTNRVKKQPPKGVHLPPSGTVPASSPSQLPAKPKATEINRPGLPESLLRLVVNVLGDIDIDILASTTPETDASLHFTGVKPELDGLKAEWQLPSKKGACKIYGCLYVDNTIDWVRALQAQWLKGNISQAVVFISKPDNSVKAIMKSISAASADLLSAIELRANSKFYGKADFTAYYFGNDWQRFADNFESCADVRMARWAFDTTCKPTAVYDETLHWVENTNGAAANYKGMKLTVFQSVDTTWAAEIDGRSVVTGLNDEGFAKTVVVGTADERAQNLATAA